MKKAQSARSGLRFLFFETKIMMFSLPGEQAPLTGELSPQVTEGFIKNAKCRVQNL